MLTFDDKEQYIDEKGLDTIMRRVNNGNDIWRITREGSRMPFVLKIRLSDDHHFLGTLTIIDLLFPWSQSSTIDDQDFAFQELGKHLSIILSFLLISYSLLSVRVLNDYADVDFEGSINKSTSHLLTKITAECFCGPCKTSVFAYVNVSTWYRIRYVKLILNIGISGQHVERYSRCLGAYADNAKNTNRCHTQYSEYSN